MNTSRVLVALGAVTLMTYGTALAQAPAQPPQAPPASPGAPPSPSPGAAAQVGAAAQGQTATGELVKVDAKENTFTVKTATGEVIIKYDDDTKVSGASKTTAGLATMSGSQVVVRYRKDGSSNMATSIDVKPAAGSSPALGEPRPSPGAPDRPSPPGGDPSKPPTPRP